MLICVLALCITVVCIEVMHYHGISLLVGEKGTENPVGKRKMRHLSPHRKAIEAKRRTNR